MNVTPYNLNNPATKPQFGAKPAEKKPSPTELKSEQAAKEANTLAQQALAQLYFAEGGDVVYLQKAKELAQLADYQTSGSGVYAAKGANLSALQALSQAAKIESKNSGKTGNKLDLVA